MHPKHDGQQHERPFYIQIHYGYAFLQVLHKCHMSHVYLLFSSYDIISYKFFESVFIVLLEKKLTQSERAPLGACHYDLDLWPFDPKIYRCLPFFIFHLCMKYEVFRSNTVRVIALQRSVDRRTDGQTDKVITIGLPHLRWRGPNKKDSWTVWC